MTARALRTCVGCGKRAPQDTLVRVVVSVGGLAPDPARRAPGRGAYFHSSPGCWRAFSRHRGRVRSLGVVPAPGEREKLVATLVASAGQAAR